MAISLSASTFVPYVIPVCFAVDEKKPTEGKEGSAEGNSTEGTDGKTQAQKTQEIMGATKGTLPIPGANAKVSWSSTAKKAQAFPVCTGTSSPTQNETATYNCAIVGKNAYGAAIPISGTVTGGEQTLTGFAPFWYKVKEGDKWVTVSSVMTIEININGYEGQTTMGGGDPFGTFGPGTGECEGDNCGWGPNPVCEGDDCGTTWPPECEGDECNSGPKKADTKDDCDGWWCPGGNGPGGGGTGGGGTGGGGNEGDNNPTANSKCPDGTYLCSNPTNGNTLFGWETGGDGTGNNPWGTGGGGTGSDPWGTGGSGTGSDPWGTGGSGTGSDPWGTGGSGTGSDPWGSGGSGNGTDPWGTGGGGTTTGTYPYDNNSSSNYGDILNELLRDNGNSYNSDDSDWLSSNGGSSGTDDLDDYLNGTDLESDDIPDGLSEDVLGVDEDLLGNSSSDEWESDGDGSEYGDEYGEGTSDGTTVDNAEEFSEGALQELMGALDGITGGTSGSLNGTDGTGSSGSSLASTLSNFLHKALDDSDKGIVGTGATEQELFDFAKKLLMANGISLEDILKGKTYDKGSAYTEPRQAWDMNRITTLLKKGKIKPNEETNTASKTNKASITNASQKSQAINASKK